MFQITKNFQLWHWKLAQGWQFAAAAFAGLNNLELKYCVEGKATNLWIPQSYGLIIVFANWFKTLRDPIMELGSCATVCRA